VGIKTITSHRPGARERLIARPRRLRKLPLVFLTLLSLFLPSSAAQQRVFLVGSGGRMEASLFAAWTEAFNRQNSTVQIGFVPTSSADGIRRVSLALSDFAAAEIRLPQEEGESSLVRIPIALIGVVPIYNLPGKAQLRFSGELLGQIYMRTVSKWNDPRIAALNPGVSLPDLPITPLDRQEGSGVKFIFDEFLSKSFSGYRSKGQHRDSTATSGGNLMVQSVGLTPGAIGYVAVTPGEHHGVAQGLVRNSAGRFVHGSQASIYAACAAKAETLEKHPEVSLVDAPGAESYPIVGFVWLYLPTSGANAARAKALRHFVGWALDEGQKYIGQGLLPLPEGTVAQARAQLEAFLP